MHDAPCSKQIAMKKINSVDKHVGTPLRMRRLMLDMSQSELGVALGLTFQQVQKYEKGANRVSASRLQHLSNILDVPVSFFFEGAPPGFESTDPPSVGWDMSAVNAFLATTDGLALVKAFASITDPKIRRAIVALVEQIGGE
jgi:transcriptional regulator with XRE-family HTH domain